MKCLTRSVTSSTGTRRTPSSPRRTCAAAGAWPFIAGGHATSSMATTSASRRSSSSMRTQAVSDWWYGRSSGTSPAQTGCGERAARAERAARRRAQHVRRRAADRVQPLLAEARQRVQQADGVRVRRIGEQRVDRGPLGGPAGVHHLHPLGDAGDHAEVVGDQHDRRVQLALDRAGCTSRICACTVTSSAVVGSSAISSDGIVGDRHGDHHALAHAAGELVRVLPGPLLRLRDADEVEQLDGPRHRLALATSPGASGSSRRSGGRCGARGSAPTADPGRSSPSACRAGGGRSSSSAPISSKPSSLAEPAMIVLDGSSPIRPRNVTDLPEPDSPTTADELAGVDVEVDAAHRLHQARQAWGTTRGSRAAPGRRGVTSAALGDRAVGLRFDGRHQEMACFGSKASRNASPMKLMHRIVRMNAHEGKTTSHH